MIVKIEVLGCNGPFPAADGATSGYLVSSGDARIVMDLGTGTLGRLTAITAPEQVTAVVFSHWHFDHTSDMLPLMYRLQACAAQPLHVYGPVDEQSPIRAAVAADATTVLHDIAPGDRLDLDGVQADVFAARHPVPAVMLRLQAEGRTLCYTGDTNEVPWLTDFARSADLLLADGLFPTAAWTEGKPHLSARLTAELADRAGAARLVITHLNPTIAPDILLQEAREVYPDAELAVRGAVYTV